MKENKPVINLLISIIQSDDGRLRCAISKADLTGVVQHEGVYRNEIECFISEQIKNFLDEKGISL